MIFISFSICFMSKNSDHLPNCNINDSNWRSVRYCVIDLNSWPRFGGDSTNDLAKLLFGDRRPRQDFFHQNDIVEETDDSINGNKFINYLNYSTRSGRSFMHGADMLPWIYEWLSNFLQKHWSSLKNVKKIRFKKPTRGDLVYTISSDKVGDQESISNVWWEFVDSNNQITYFYGKDTNYARQRQTCANILPKKLLLFDTSTPIYQVENLLRQNVVKIPLSNQNDYDTSYYIHKMEQNNWYMWTTVLDMVNAIYRLKLETPWLVAGYENLVTYGDPISPELLFDWSCTLLSHMEWDPFPMWDGLWYKVLFEIIHSSEKKILDGCVTFYAGR